jgi:hypothetical protein
MVVVLMRSRGVTGNALYTCGLGPDINDANIVDCSTNGAWTSSNGESIYSIIQAQIRIQRQSLKHVL